jgi:DNA-binding response OmpR family regulator
MMHVLLFDDEHDVSIIVRRTLEEHGYFVSVTAVLDDARQMLERVKFDLVIVNILLPDGAAFEVMETAKEKGIRTFFMTYRLSRSSRSRVAVAKTGRRPLPEAAPAEAALPGRRHP